MRRFLVSLLCALVLFSPPVLARDETNDGWDRVTPPVFSHLTVSDGLPYPVALGVAQDQRGFIWAATPGGLARWDGYRVTAYRHDDQDPNSLPENIVTGVMTDPAGRLWLSTVSGVVARYDESLDGFVAYRMAEGNLGRALGMAAFGADDILFAGRTGLFRLEVGTGTWRREAGLPNGEIASVLVDQSTGVWIGTAQGLMRRGSGDDSFQTVPMSAELDGDMVSALFQDQQGTIWFGTRRGRVGTVAGSAEAQGRIEPLLPASGFRVTSFAEPRPGTIWVADYGGGIREFSSATGSVRSFKRDAAMPASLGDNSVTQLLVDRAGLVWASSLRGIHRHIPNNHRIFTVVQQEGGLPGPDVRSVAANGDGRVWAGFRAEGVKLIDPRSNAAEPGLWFYEGLPRGMVQALADTRDGGLWVGQQSGLSRIDIETGRVTPYAPLVGADIFALYHDGAYLWAGGSVGLARIPLAGGPPKLYRADRDDQHSLSDNSVYAIHRDRAGRLWVGTLRGLNELADPEAGLFRRILHDPDLAQSLPSDSVIGIAEDRIGRLWVATPNGLGIFNPERDGGPLFTRLGRANGLGSPVLSVIESDDGSMVASTGQGLAVINADNLQVRRLGPADGVEIDTFWAGAATRMGDGTLVFGGYGGMAVMRPSLLPDWDYVPPVVVTALHIGRSIRRPADRIVVEPDDGGFQVEVAALDFSAPNRILYAHRLNRGQWTTVEAHHRTIGYTHLPPGTHDLEIRASNSAGIWGGPSLHLAIEVMPSWHQTAWFRLTAAMALVAAGVAVFMARKAYHHRREKALARLVEAKTQEAEAAKLRALAGEEEARRAMAAAEAAHQTKSRFLAIIGHEIRTPLNGLLGMLQVFEPRTLDRQARDYLAMAKEAGDSLSQLVESLLEYGHQGAVTSELAVDDVDVGRLARQVLEMVRPQAEAKGVRLTLTLRPQGPIRVGIDQAKLTRILLNLVGNAAKFTPAGSITLDVALEDLSRLSIAVTDTGIGIPPEMREAIFVEFTQADDSIARQFGGVGLGLALSRRLAEQMGGALRLDESLSGGSRFLLDLPIVRPEPRLADVGEDRAAPSGLWVLVVDDDEINLLVAEHMLTRLGHRTCRATSGEEAVAALAGRSFDIVLMDLRMPGMDGIEATRLIRRREAEMGGHTKIIAMTAEMTEPLWARCREAGMDGKLAKPVRLELLKAVMVGSDVLPARPVPAVIDGAHLKEQVEILGMPQMVRLARRFHKAAREMLLAMDEAVEAGDRETIAALAHRLRSAAGPLGLTGLAEAAAHLQADAATVSAGELRPRVARLDDARRQGMRLLAEMSRSGCGVAPV